MSDVSQLVQDYIEDTLNLRAKMQDKLFRIFTETTGHRPEDLVLVEQRVSEGTAFKTIFYYDWKHRYTKAEIPK